MPIKSITPTEVYRLQQESGALTILDVREPEEFVEIRSQIAQNTPLSSFNPDSVLQTQDRKAPVFIVCRSGVRSMKAAKLLAQRGFELVYNIEGGMTAWLADGLPATRS